MASTPKAETDQPGNTQLAPSQAKPQRPVDVATAVVALIAGLIAMGEIGRLASGVLSDELASRSFGELQSITAAWNTTEAWTHWQTVVQQGSDFIPWWLFWTGVADVVFFVGYLWLLGRLAEKSDKQARDSFIQTAISEGFSTEEAHRLADEIAPGVARRCVTWLLCVEILETLLLWLAAFSLRDATVGWFERWPLAVVAEAKWLVVIVLLLALLRDAGVRRTVGRGLRRSFHALRVQRLSLFIVVLLAVLSLLPLPNLFDQFPDVIRGWFDTSWTAFGHLVAGVLAYAVAGIAMLVLGRQRSERSWRTWALETVPTEGDEDRRWVVRYRWWFIGPLGALATAGVLLAFRQRELIDCWVLLVFCLVPLLLVLASLGIRAYYRRPDRTLWREEPNGQDVPRALDTWVAGDVLAIAGVVVGALAVVRALIAPMLLEPDARILALVVGLVVAGGAFRAADRRLTRLDKRSMPPQGRFPRLVVLLRPDQLTE